MFLRITSKRFILYDVTCNMHGLKLKQRTHLMTEGAKNRHKGI